MTLHYHGTPISPMSVLYQLAGRNFCVSYARPDDVERVHEIGQSVMLDNGAFSVWRRGETPDWPGYYRWCERWLEYPTTWAVIPDAIDGTEAENDVLVEQWPFGYRGAPVWHLHESLERLLDLAEEWPRVCIGSSGQYATLGTPQWRRRMDQAFNTLLRADLLGGKTWLHMLRGMALAGQEYPFASLDSTDVGRNHNRDTNPDPLAMALRWDRAQCPPRWTFREQLELA